MDSCKMPPHVIRSAGASAQHCTKCSRNWPVGSSRQDHTVLTCSQDHEARTPCHWRVQPTLLMRESCPCGHPDAT
eukprot:11758540-Alexandrium_andersonii.AAC.1